MYPVGMGKTSSHLGPYDRIVEADEVDGLLQRIQDVLDERGVLTVADYQNAKLEAHNDAHRIVVAAE